MLRDQAFEAHQAGGRNRPGAYLALFKGRKLDAVHAAGQKPGEVCLAHAERQLAVAIARRRDRSPVAKLAQMLRPHHCTEDRASERGRPALPCRRGTFSSAASHPETEEAIQWLCRPSGIACSVVRPGTRLTHIGHEAFRHRGNIVGIGGVNSVAVRTRRASSAALACPFAKERSINVVFANPSTIVAPRTVLHFSVSPRGPSSSAGSVCATDKLTQRRLGLFLTLITRYVARIETLRQAGH